MTDEIERVGKCPICGVELEMSMGYFVECPNGDYKAEFEKWDEVWNSVTPKTVDGEKLVKDLLELNLVEGADEPA